MQEFQFNWTDQQLSQRDQATLIQLKMLFINCVQVSLCPPFKYLLFTSQTEKLIKDNSTIPLEGVEYITPQYNACV